MSNYVIGDLQGHYDGLQRLLEKIQFNPPHDQLWLIGDLVNRGPESLKTLRWLSQLDPAPKVCLGNHDLFLLHHLYSQSPQGHPLDLQAILTAHDRDHLGEWLRQHVFLHHHHDAILVHAGIAPMWSIQQAQNYAQELTTVLRDDQCFYEWMNHYFDPRPMMWSEQLQELRRWQVLADYFTRIRFTTYFGELNFSSHGDLSEAPTQCYPWFACPTKTNWDSTIIFGHWAALLGKTGFKKIKNIDTGFHWGNTLTALNLDNFQTHSTF